MKNIERRLIQYPIVHRPKSPNQTLSIMVTSCFATTNQKSHIKRLDELSKELPSIYDKSYSSITDAYNQRRDVRKELRKTISNSTKLRR